jgi:hypothetical protein
MTIYRTNGEWLRAESEKRGIPLVSVWAAQDTLARCKARAKGKNEGLDKTMASAMLRHGRLTDEARAWVAREYPQ